MTNKQEAQLSLFLDEAEEEPQAQSPPIGLEQRTDGVSSSTELGEVLDDLVGFIRRYVVLTPDQADTIALWVVHTHAIEAAETTPYIQITSAEKRSGKSRLLEVLELLVARPLSPGAEQLAAIRKVFEPAGVDELASRELIQQSRCSTSHPTTAGGTATPTHPPKASPHGLPGNSSRTGSIHAISASAAEYVRGTAVRTSRTLGIAISPLSLPQRTRRKSPTTQAWPLTRQPSPNAKRPALSNSSSRSAGRRAHHDRLNQRGNPEV